MREIADPETGEWFPDHVSLDRGEVREAIKQTGYAMGYIIRQLIDDDNVKKDKLTGLIKEFQTVAKKNRNLYFLDFCNSLQDSRLSGHVNYEASFTQYQKEDQTDSQ